MKMRKYKSSVMCFPKPPLSEIYSSAWGLRLTGGLESNLKEFHCVCMFKKFVMFFLTVKKTAGLFAQLQKLSFLRYNT